MTEIQHRDLAGGRWLQLSLFEQLANIGSEVSRANRWLPRNRDLARAAVFRALELLDLTLDDPRLRATPHRLREIARLREVLADHYEGDDQYGCTGESLQRYLDQYASGLRRQR